MSDEEVEAAAGTWVYGQGVVDDEFMQAMLTAGFKAGARWAAARVPVPGESEAREALDRELLVRQDEYSRHNVRRDRIIDIVYAWLASRPSVREAQEGKAEAARNRLHDAADAIRAVQREAREGT